MQQATTPERVRAFAGDYGLTNEEIGDIVGATGRTVGRWWAGEVSPRRPAEQRLRELLYVLAQMSDVMRPADAREWLFMPNRLLQHDTPAQRIEKGDYRTVLGLIEALADGIVV